MNNLCIVILAAGKGTRMESDKAKVLHLLKNKSLISHVMESSQKVDPSQIVVVLGYKASDVQKHLEENNFSASFAFQEEQKGTAHAVICAMDKIQKNIKNIMILYGDTPLISHKSLLNFFQTHIKNQNTISLMGANLENPFGYGRIVLKNNQVVEIVEEADASDEIKKIKLINSGIYCVEKDFLDFALKKIGNNNKQKEFYLTDILSIAYKNNKKIGLFINNNSCEILGINSRNDLNNIEKTINK